MQKEERTKKIQCGKTGVKEEQRKKRDKTRIQINGCKLMKRRKCQKKDDCEGRENIKVKMNDKLRMKNNK